MMYSSIRKTWNNTEGTLAQIMESIKASGMRCKPSKCEFHKTETEYLGFIINQEGVQMDPVKTKAIWEWDYPKNKTDIQCFMGFCNFIEGL